MKTLPWSQPEDEYIARCYANANGAMTPYSQMARALNNAFHEGKDVRKPQAVCRREGVVCFGKKSNQPSLI